MPNFNSMAGRYDMAATQACLADSTPRAAFLVAIETGRTPTRPAADKAGPERVAALMHAAPAEGSNPLAYRTRVMACTRG